MTHDAQRAQGLDPAQLPRLEFEELLVAGDEFTQLQFLLVALAGQEHPQVLDRRRRQAVVEVDEVRRVVAPQDVAAMAVAVHADEVAVADLVAARQQQLLDVGEEAEVGGAEIVGDEHAR